MDISSSYEIRKAGNGGFTILERNFTVPGEAPATIAAFTTPADMITWLAEQYGVRSTVEVTGEMVISPTLGGPLTHDQARAGWIEHDGSDMLKSNHGRPCMVLERDGTARAGKTCDIARNWAWKYHFSPRADDVVGYRYV